MSASNTVVQLEALQKVSQNTLIYRGSVTTLLTFWNVSVLKEGKSLWVWKIDVMKKFTLDKLPQKIRAGIDWSDKMCSCLDRELR